MASATFEEHPTDPDKMILRKPRLDQGADYERGFVDGMQYQMQTSVDKAVNAMSRTWVGLTDREIFELFGVKGSADADINPIKLLADARRIEEALRKKNNG
jgi:hypothetical protein